MRAFPGRFPLNTALAVLGLGACAPTAADDVPLEDVTSVQSEIVNGTDLNQVATQTFGLVAIYHPPLGGAPGWAGRPCSGIIFQAGPTVTWILTARHCVTVDTIQGSAIASLDRIKVMPGPTPGLGTPNGPPAGAAPAIAIFGAPIPPPPAPEPGRWDQALVAVAGNWAPLQALKYGVWVSAPSHLATNHEQFSAFGYGINQNDQNCGSNGSTVGAGTARFGTFFVDYGTPAPVPPNLGGFTNYNNNVGPNGPGVFCGDSGGPDIASLGLSNGSVWPHIIGVHHSGVASVARSSTPAQSLQEMIGGLFLSPDALPNFNMYVNQSFLPSLVTTPTQATKLRYDPYTERIWVNSLGVNGRCLTAIGSGGSQPTFQPCQDVPSQRWTIAADRRIRSVSSGLCLTSAGPSLVTNACASSMPQSASQFWAFHPQQYIYETYTTCAGEGGQCAFTGTKSVRYGANGNYVYRVLANGTPCNNATFGDPIPGVPKQCAIGPTGFDHCANQNGQCSFTGNKVVAYGARNSFYYKPFNNGAPCTVSAFGGDPLVGVPKACYVANGQ